MAAEIDARDVLTSYSELLARNQGKVVRDLAELPYSKDVVKQVLMHCIRLTEPGKEREFLRTAYIALADFQALSLHEKESLDAWNSSLNISSGAQNLDDLRKEAQKLSTSGDDVIRVHERVSAECASLLRELQVAGF